MVMEHIGLLTKNGTGENYTVYEMTTNVSDNMTSQSKYDDVGAMQYILAVVLVYGVAVIGVFVLSYFGRRKRDRVDIDRQATTYIRSMKIMRGRLEKKHRLESIKSLLETQGGMSSKYNGNVSGVVGNGMFAYMALPFIATRPGTSVSSKISEEKTGNSFNTSSNNNEDKISLDVLDEVDEGSDGDDDVFMNAEEESKYGVDFYI